MRTRFSFVMLATLSTVLLVIGLLPSSSAAPISPQVSQTPQRVILASKTSIPFVPDPTRPEKTATSIPLQATRTAAPTGTFKAVPSETLIVFATMTPTTFAGTATPPVPVAFSRASKPVACYKGPGPEYVVKTDVKLAQIVGKDSAEKWWYLIIHQGEGVFFYCWVSSAQVHTAGNLSGVLVNEPEQAQITEVKLDVDGIQTVSCENPPLQVTGHIFSDGPIENVSYFWETDSATHFPPGQVTVKSWDAPAEIKLEFSLPAQAGMYFLRLSTSYPIEKSDVVQFEVKCN